MNREEPYRNQAERLKQRIEKINGGMEERETEKEVLPPREHLHRKKKTKTKWKLKYPVIRLLVLFFILLPVISFSVISYLGDKKVNRAEKTNADPIGYETINLDSKDSAGTTQSEDSGNDSTSETVITDPTDNAEEVDKKEDPEKSNAAEDTANSTNNQESDKNTAQAEQKSTQPEQKETTSTNTNTNTTKFIYYTVKKGDTLFHISDVYFHSPRGMAIIMQANHMTSDQVQVGEVLKIPTSN